MTTNVPRPSYGPTGFVAPTEAEILAGVLADLDAAFGGGLNPSLATPQGQLATSTAAIVGDANATFIWFTNQVDPAYAEGRMQDALGRIYFLTRIAGAPTVVRATCSGLGGVQIPVGALARAEDGNLYVCQLAGEIAQGGTVELPFACAVNGPLPCPAGSLNQIYQTVFGWDSITNAADGALGRNVESRAEFEERRRASTAIGSTGQLSSILGAVLAVEDVVDGYATENPTDGPLTVGGIVLKPHSIYVAALGGDPQAVAQAIWSRKAPGAGYNGNTIVTVTDPNPIYGDSPPIYEVTYEIPEAVDFLVLVTLRAGPSVPADYADQVADAVVAAWAGEDDGPRARIGSTVLASRYYGPVAALGAWARIVSVQVGRRDGAAHVVGSISGTTLTVTGVLNGVLSVGDVVTGTGMTPGTVIEELGTGTGGPGTYVVAPTQLALSQPLTATTVADLVVLSIDEAPTIAAEDVQVHLR